MRFFIFFLIISILYACSFDDKSGIWQNQNVTLMGKKDQFKDFKKISISAERFDKEIILDKKSNVQTLKPINNFEFNDVFYNNENNLANFKFSGQNKSIFKSKKITRYKINKSILYKNENLISSDENGNIIVFSIKDDRIVSKYNFYKKKFKKLKKKLNYIIDENIIFISDNLGFLYAYDFTKNKIIWAKDYKIPFRSNLKLSNNKLIASNQNNNLLFFNKISGDLFNSIPTEETNLKNQFVNNLSLNKKNLFFINSYGSLYSINIDKMKIDWFINLNQSSNLNPANIFLGNELVFYEDKILISANESTYIINANTGNIIHKFNFFSIVRPIINNDIAFLTTENDLLVSINLKNNKILFSRKITNQVAKFLNTKNKNKLDIIYIFLLNNKIYIFLQNSFLLKFNLSGELSDIYKLPSKINSSPIIIDQKILFINKKNNLEIMD